MKHPLFVFLTFLFFGCQPNAYQQAAAPETPITNNQELIQLEAEDQADRTPPIDWATVSVRDSLRLKRAYELYESEQLVTAQDYRNAAMIFQHGLDTMASGMAVRMMREAISRDSSINKWLYAAAVDRDLMRREEPQIYGTQYRRLDGGDWFLHEIDSTQVTDAERVVYGVETLAQQRAKVIAMNKQSLMELHTAGTSIVDIIALCRNDNDPLGTDYDLSEDGLNVFGYYLMGTDQNEAAKQIFALNVERHSEGFNTYDSYGECLLKMGETNAGVAAYKQSLALNPNNTHAAAVIAEHEGE